MYPLGETWIDQNLDSILMKHVRSWLRMLISTSMKEELTLPKHRGGFGIPTTLHLYRKLSLVKRSALKNSSRPQIRQVWTDTSAKNIATDSLLCSSDGLSEAKKTSEIFVDPTSRISSPLPGTSRSSNTSYCRLHSEIRDWAVVKSGRSTAGFLIPLCEEGTPAAASNSLQPGEMEENSKSRLHALQEIDPPDKQTSTLQLWVPSRMLFWAPQQNSWEDCSLDRFKQISGSVLGGRSPIFDIPSYRLGLQAYDQTGYRTVR